MEAAQDDHPALVRSRASDCFARRSVQLTRATVGRSQVGNAQAGELFGEMASILGERERTARAVTATNAVIDVIDSTTMQRKLGEADPVLRALVRNLTIRLADANKMNEERWLLLNVYQSLAPDEIERP